MKKLFVLAAIALFFLIDVVVSDSLVRDYESLRQENGLNDIIIDNDGYLIFKGPVHDDLMITLQKNEGGNQIIYFHDMFNVIPGVCGGDNDLCVYNRTGSLLYKTNLLFGNINRIRVDVKAGDVLKLRIEADPFWDAGLEVWTEEIEDNCDGSIDEVPDKLIVDFGGLRQENGLNDIIIDDDGYLIFKGPVHDDLRVILEKSSGKQTIYCHDMHFWDDGGRCPSDCDTDHVCIYDREGNLIFDKHMLFGDITRTRVDVESGEKLKFQIGADHEWNAGLEIWEPGLECRPECIDNDGDGYGENCGPGPDCDDANPNVHPGAIEICNGIDDDCDGIIDENFPNLGDSCTVGVGECEESGNYICTQNGSGTECDATAGVPTIEICDGLDNDCDGIIDDGGNDLCDDGAWCDGAEICAGVSGCQEVTAPDCEDGDVCTLDSCDEVNDECVNEPIDDCCVTDTDCNDQNTCTTDQCVDNECLNSQISCNDGVDCTQDTCDSVQGCVNAPDDGYCDDGEWCTGTETCDSELGCLPSTDPCAYFVNECVDVSCDEAEDECVETPITDCCLTDIDCNDQDACTSDSCVNNDCVNTQIQDCCYTNADCNDQNICTSDACVANECVNSDIPDCCYTDNDCTSLDMDYCDSNVIKHDEGKCINYQCQAETDTVQDCDEKDGIINQCGLAEWSCSEELNTVDCVLTNIEPTNDFCADSCDGDIALHGYCSPLAYTCQYAQEDCNNYDNNYCNGTQIIYEDYSCINTGCALIDVESIECNNGLYCDGQETCQNTQCVQGTPIYCSNNDIEGIDTCGNNPDGNPFTYDFRVEFTSVCNEGTDSCTVGYTTINHECSVNSCNAECDSIHGCEDTDCDNLDGCNGNNYYDYSGVDNTCQSDCACTDNQCEAPIISYNDSRCTACQIDDDCDDGLFCNGEERCTNYECVQGIVVNCNDQNICTLDSCDEANDECVNEHIDNCCVIDTDCNDQNACTTDQCVDNECLNSQISCNDGVDCTQDTCDLVQGCVNTPDDSYCDDGEWCTGTETCDSELGCLPSTDPCTYFVDLCTEISCDESEDECVETPITDCCLTDIDCNDQDVCTADSCVNNVCVNNDIQDCCYADNDCNNLDRDYCDGNIVKHDEGKCINYQCQAETDAVQDCDQNNGVMNECGLIEWSCSEELNTVDCVVTNIEPTDDFCADSCDGDARNDGNCNSTTYRCSYITEDCNILDRDYCDGTEIKHGDYTCNIGACVLDSTTILQDCDDSLACNGQETCSNANCVQGTAVDCSNNNLGGIAACDNNPDNNPFTYDYRQAFTSQCTEPLGQCTTGDDVIIHTCDIDNCNTECDSTHGCEDTDCDNLDGCNGNNYYDYSDVDNTCQSDCICTDNQCEVPIVYENDPRCTVCQVDDDCDDGLFCNGEERCTNYECVQGIPADCSANNIGGIATCDNNPDGNPFTFDYRVAFSSVCNGGRDECTIGNISISYTCNMNDCGAECEEDIDCIDIDQGTSDFCLADCTCGHSLNCIDNDNDGYNITGGTCGPVDCDDSDPAVYPGAPELKDGKDNDCDGGVDEGFIQNLIDKLPRETFLIKKIRTNKLVYDEVKPGDLLFVDLQFENIGREDTRYTTIRITQQELGISKKLGPFRGPEANEVMSRGLYLEVPDDAEPGVYSVRISLSNLEGIRRTRYRDFRVTE